MKGIYAPPLLFCLGCRVQSYDNGGAVYYRDGAVNYRDVVVNCCVAVLENSYRSKEK
ncbi:MAG: hypothetical protein MJY90_01240 [Bacteroidaceae bacterium]|nr:hypothetical protein [Bacteroidaceae bacterium]